MKRFLKFHRSGKKKKLKKKIKKKKKKTETKELLNIASFVYLQISTTQNRIEKTLVFACLLFDRRSGWSMIRRPPSSSSSSSSSSSCNSFHFISRTLEGGVREREEEVYTHAQAKTTTSKKKK